MRAIRRRDLTGLVLAIAVCFGTAFGLWACSAPSGGGALATQWAANSAAPNRGQPWLIVSPDCSAAALADARRALTAAGARVLQIHHGAAMVVRGTPAQLRAIDGRPDLRRFATAEADPVPPQAAPQCRAALAAAAAAWRRAQPQLAGATPWSEPPRGGAAGPPLSGDAFRSPLASAKGTTGSMLGDVGVVLLTPESNGAIDPNTETWTSSLWNQVYSQVADGLAWWADHADAHGKSVAFELYYVERTDPALQTGYEPISHPSSDQCLWINDIMNNFGYYNYDCFANVDAANSAWESYYGKDSFYSIFVVNSEHDADGAFADGYFGYAFYGGPFEVMTTDNGGWGIDYMHMVTAHETGHIFHACDEYYEPGYAVCACDCPENPWQTDNNNCDHSCGANLSCVMRDNTLTTCLWTEEQVGWSDDDDDDDNDDNNDDNDNDDNNDDNDNDDNDDNDDSDDDNDDNDDNDNDDNGGDDDNANDIACETVCARIGDCGLAGRLDFSAMDECLASCAGTSADQLECLLNATNCEALAACLGVSLGDDDDDHSGGSVGCGS
jgi:hypothetical protein